MTDASDLRKELKRRHTREQETEMVLILQGGGSLGAYECGVYKTLEKNGIVFDVVAGTSIGGINAGIIAGAKDGSAASSLEAFWREVAEYLTSSWLPDSMRPFSASMYSAAMGNPKVFFPMWLSLLRNHVYDPMFFFKQPFLYDLSPLKKTLDRYIDFSKINNKSKPRLIITSTDIKRSEAVTFDSLHQTIDIDHLTASAGFPFYGIAWTEKEGKYLWDGSLLSNTPLREVIYSSPKRDKKVYIVNLFPRIEERLPENMLDSLHRARDILYSDRTSHNIKMSKVISRYLLLLKEMYELLSQAKLNEECKARLRELSEEYHKLADERGPIIREIVRIERKEEVPFIFEDADFSIATIRKLIKEGEEDAQKILNDKKNQ